MAIWRKNEVAFTFLDDLVAHPIVAIAIDTPAGELRVMAVVQEAGRIMTLSRLHMHGEQAAARNSVGPGNLKVLAQIVMEGLDLDGLVIEGARRTTGAGAGRTPRRIRFTRHLAD
jgi:hypothetical protein